MHRLQVFCLEVDVAPRHLERAVPEDALEAEHVAASADIVHREGMTQCMPASREP